MQRCRDEAGAALPMALLLLALAALVGGALVLTTATEELVSAHHRSANELLLASDAGLERARAELARLPSWDEVLAGGAVSTCRDVTLVPRLADRRELDLVALTAALQASSDASAPWGPDNPRWRLFVYGSLELVTGLPPGARASPYVVVWVADDQADGDGNSGQDANQTLWLRAESHGVGLGRKMLEATVARPAPYPASLRLLSWRFAP